MAPYDHDRRDGDNNAPTEQSIPLQDLSRTSEASTGDSRTRRRIGSARRSLFSRPVSGGTNYQRIVEDTFPSSTVDRDTTPNNPDDDDDGTPVIDDPSSFARASIGLSFGSPQQLTPRASYEYSDVPLSPLFKSYTNDQFISPGDYYMSTVDTNEDTTHLTDRLQPVGQTSTTHSDQDSTRAVHFADNELTQSRLGDDLPRLEAGLGHSQPGGSGSRGRSRSLTTSPSRKTAFGRASSMMKTMSQRVVNLSNEPEVLEHSIQKEESMKNSRLEEPPELPAIESYAHDSQSQADLPSDGAPAEKKPEYRDWKLHDNPLRGKSLGILGPNNPIRTSLCDILVHPFMEPFVLLVILLHVILLTIQTSSSRFAYSSEYGHMDPTEFVFVVIFSIYTLELLARILVSGFIFNAGEYSTLDRSLGWKKAAVQRSKNIIEPLRRTSIRKIPSTTAVPQVSILRTFTGLNQQEETTVDERQKQRIRLARRAFLRHSFNRLDFVAVVTFWVYFLLLREGIEIHRLFHMLSCLRILRLLSITNGTSVS